MWDTASVERKVKPIDAGDSWFHTCPPVPPAVLGRGHIHPACFGRFVLLGAGGNGNGEF